MARHDRSIGGNGSLVRALRGSSLVRFGALSLTVLGALFWARQKLISPTPRMAVADPQAERAPSPAPASRSHAGANADVDR